MIAFFQFHLGNKKLCFSSQNIAKCFSIIVFSNRFETETYVKMLRKLSGNIEGTLWETRENEKLLGNGVSANMF